MSNIFLILLTGDKKPGLIHSAGLVSMKLLSIS